MRCILGELNTLSGEQRLYKAGEQRLYKASIAVKAKIIPGNERQRKSQ